MRFARLNDADRDIAPFVAMLDDIANDVGREIDRRGGDTANPALDDIVAALQATIPVKHGFQATANITTISPMPT